MASMCEECKCSTYYNEELDTYACENDCPCCHDPNWESDWDTHLRIMKQVREYVNIYLISLRQDSEELQEQLDSVVIDADEFDELNIQDIRLNGQMSAASHILDYIDNLQYDSVE